MKTMLLPALVILSTAWIAYQTWRRKEPRICFFYAAGIAVIAASAWLTDDVQMICCAAPLSVLIGREWQKTKQESAPED